MTTTPGREPPRRSVPSLAPKERLSGARREKVLTYLVGRYLEDRASIRDLADEIGRSYGNVHTLLEEAGVTLRPSGGDGRRK